MQTFYQKRLQIGNPKIVARLEFRPSPFEMGVILTAVFSGGRKDLGREVFSAIFAVFQRPPRSKAFSSV
jgi:hypothetical protein